VGDEAHHDLGRGVVGEAGVVAAVVELVHEVEVFLGDVVECHVGRVDRGVGEGRGADGMGR
jgi:hypothetical protein